MRARSDLLVTIHSLSILFLFFFATQGLFFFNFLVFFHFLFWKVKSGWLAKVQMLDGDCFT